MESENGLAGHPDRMRWNARYGTGFTPSFTAHPVAVAALALDLPDGPVADLACGPSGSALLAAAQGRRVTAVNVSEVALGLLAREAGRRGLDHLITLVQADLRAWLPVRGRYALMLATGFWDGAAFAAAVPGLAPGGVLGWEAFTTVARQGRPTLPAAWCLSPGAPGHAPAGRHDRAQPGGHSRRPAGHPPSAAGPPGRLRLTGPRLTGPGLPPAWPAGPAPPDRPRPAPRPGPPGRLRLTGPRLTGLPNHPAYLTRRALDAFVS